MSSRKRSASPRRSSGWRDLAWVLLTVAALFTLGAVFQAYDRIETTLHTAQYLDEAFALAVMLMGGIAVLAIRRWRQADIEHALREEAEARIRAVIEESPAVSYTWDARSRRAIYVSPQIDHLLGYSAEEWSTPDLWIEALHPNDRERVLEASHLSDGTGRPFIQEYRVLKSDGRELWIHDESNYVSFDTDGRPTLAQGVMYDITAQVEAEARRREAEAKFRAIVEHVPAVSYVWDSAMRSGDAPASYISPQIEQLLGYSAESWLRDPHEWERVTHEEDRGRVIASWDRAVEDHAPFSEEYRIRRADGGWVWLRDEANPVGAGPSGSSIYQGVMFDITDRKEAELRLRDNEARSRNLLENLPVVAYMLDRHEDGTTRDRWISPGIHALVGLTAEEWLGDDDPWGTLIHPDDRERVLGLWDAHERGAGGRFHDEYRMLHADGSTVWVREESVLMRHKDGIYLEGVFIDVTALRTAEAAAREAEERYRSLVEQLPVAVYTDAADDVSTALYISPQYERLTGYTPDQRVRDPDLWTRMLHPDDRDGVLAESARTNQTGDPFDVEYRISSADGRTVWLHDHAIMVEGPEGRPVWQGVLTDVTEAKLAQEALSRRDRILQATGFAAESFLQEASWEDVLDPVLARLGEAGEASRAYVYANDAPTLSGPLTVSLVREWSLPSVPSLGDDAINRNFPWTSGGFGRWVDLLSSGTVIHGPTQGFPESERALLQSPSAQIRSLLVVPIFVRGEWWGYIGFDHTDEDRIWQEAEIEALAVTANTLGAAVARAHAARELAETQRRYQTLVEQIPAMTYVERANEGGTLYYSPQTLEVLGYAADEWGEYHHWLGALHPDDRERVVAEDERTNRTGEPFRLEYRLLAKDGRVVWVRDQAVLVRDEDGMPVYWQGVRFDVTAEKGAEEQLRSAEERYRGIVEHVPAAIYLDRAGRAMDTIYISPQIEQISGITPQEWLADPQVWVRAIHPDDRDEVLDDYLAAAETSTPWNAEYRMRTPDGRTIWVHDETTFLHDEQGEVVYLQGVIFDVTERKLAEHALRESEQRERDAAERLRALDDMKNTFLAAVSHELRSPLTSILGLSLTLERAPDMSDDDRDDLLERLAANARKLDRLLKDLLDIDRLNRGIVEPQYRVTDVGALARRTVESLDSLTGRDIVTETDAIVLSVDPPKMERIVENLLTNAARHTAGDRRIWLRVHPHEGGVLIMVEDDGPGVAADLKGAIFEPFHQGPTVSPHAPGTGIGLSLVARFAELHGGHAWVEDRDGGGASFRVFIPGKPGVAARIAPSTPEPCAEAN